MKYAKKMAVGGPTKGQLAVQQSKDRLKTKLAQTSAETAAKKAARDAASAANREAIKAKVAANKAARDQAFAAKREAVTGRPTTQPVVGRTKAQIAAGAGSTPATTPATKPAGGGFKFGSTPTGGGKPAPTSTVTSNTVTPTNVVKPSGPAPGTRMMNMRSGGSVGSASKRADGIASRGKTRGKFV